MSVPQRPTLTQLAHEVRGGFLFSDHAAARRTRESAHRVADYVGLAAVRLGGPPETGEQDAPATPASQ